MSDPVINTQGVRHQLSASSGAAYKYLRRIGHGHPGGTVSPIRREVRKVIPIYRNSESSLSVSSACRKNKYSNSKIFQDVKRLGGPGWIRTSDLTVMSGMVPSSSSGNCIRSPLARNLRRLIRGRHRHDQRSHSAPRRKALIARAATLT
jgi:hypothetical protein